MYYKETPLPKKRNYLYTIALIFLLVSLSFLFGMTVGIREFSANDPSTVTVYSNCETKDQPALHADSMATIRLPAVNRNGTGVTANLDVYVIPGNGMVLANLNRVISREETLQSMRTAAYIASEITNLDISGYDIVYDIHAHAPVLEGPSAGAAMTIATIAALTGKDVSEDVMITGTINHDGTIGPAGKIKEKAESARDSGATRFYVPVGLATEINYTEEEFCKIWGDYEYCEAEVKSDIIDIEKEVGIPIIEAVNIQSILDDFLVDKV